MNKKEALLFAAQFLNNLADIKQEGANNLRSTDRRNIYETILSIREVVDILKYESVFTRFENDDPSF